MMRSVVMASASDMRTDARVSREAEAMAAAGWNVSIICVASVPSANIKNVALKEFRHPKKWRSARLLVDIIQISTRLILTRADVYHAHCIHPLPAAWLSARLHGGRVVYDAHEILSGQTATGRRGYSIKQRLECGVERWLTPRVDLCVTVSDRYAEQIASAAKVAAPLIVPNYPPLAPMVECSPLRERVGAKQETILLLYQGGYYLETRALDVVIKAMKRLPIEYKLVLLGFGPNDEERQLAELIAREQLQSRVTMLPAVSHQDLPAFTAGADVGIIPFRLDSLAMQLCSPNKLYEYLSGGVAVLASPAEELISILEETGAGVVYSPDDPDDFAAKVQSLGQTRHELKAVGARGRKAAEDVYCWESVSHVLVEAYARVVSG